MFILLFGDHSVTKIGPASDPNESRRTDLLDDGYSNESGYLDGNLNKERFIQLSLSTYEREIGQLTNEISTLERESRKIKDPNKLEQMRNKIFALKELVVKVKEKIKDIENTKDTDQKFGKLKALNEFVDWALGNTNETNNSMSVTDTLKNYGLGWLLGNDSVKDAVGSADSSSNNTSSNGGIRGLGTLFEKLWTNFNKILGITKPIRINMPRFR